MATVFNINQLFYEHFNKGNTLDLCFADQKHFNVPFNDGMLELVPCDAHHIQFIINYKDSLELCYKPSANFFNFDSLDINKFNSFLTKNNFSFLYTVDTGVNADYD